MKMQFFCLVKFRFEIFDDADWSRSQRSATSQKFNRTGFPVPLKVPTKSIEFHFISEEWGKSKTEGCKFKFRFPAEHLQIGWNRYRNCILAWEVLNWYGKRGKGETSDRISYRLNNRACFQQNWIILHIPGMEFHQEGNVVAAGKSLIAFGITCSGLPYLRCGDRGSVSPGMEGRHRCCIQAELTRILSLRFIRSDCLAKREFKRNLSTYFEFLECAVATKRFDYPVLASRKGRRHAGRTSSHFMKVLRTILRYSDLFCRR